MTYKIFRELYEQAREYDNINLYIMERGWQDWMNDLSGADVISDVLKKIYSLANSDNKWKAISEEFRNFKEISDIFGIPYKTMQNWNSGHVRPSEYLLLLIAYAVINDICEKKEEK